MTNGGTAQSASGDFDPLDQNGEEDFHRLVGLIPNLRYRIDHTGVLLWASPATANALQRRPEDLVGKRFEELFPPEQTGRQWAVMASDLERLGLLIFKHALRLESGEKWVETRLSARPGQTGENREIIGVTREVADPQPTEEALRQSEERLRSTLKAAGVVAWELDGRGQLHEAGPVDLVFGRPTGFHHAGMDELAQDIHPEDWERIRSRIQEAWRGGGDYHAEYRVPQPDGSVRWLEANGTALCDKAGRPERLLGIARDITERKRAEDSLRASEAFLDTIIEQSPQSMWVSDAHGTLIRMNQACRRLLHATDEELVGKYNVLADNVVEEQGAMPAVKRAFEQGERVQFTLRYDSARLRLLRLGETTQVVLEVTISPVLDARGRVVHAIIQHLDITERERAQAALRESEERLRLALAATKQGLYDLNLQTGKAVVSPEYVRMLGYEPGEIEPLADRWRERLHLEDREASFRMLQECARGERTEFRTEYRLKTKSGDWRWLLSLGRVVECDAGGRPLRLLGTHTDITERKQAEMELLREKLFTEKLLESLPGIFFLYDSTCHLKRWNKAHETATGFSAEELRDWYIPDWHETPEDAAKGMALVKSVLETGTGGAFETTLINKEGRFVPYLISITRLLTPDGPVMMGVGIDTTERKQAEAALQRSESVLRATIEAISDGVLVISEGDHISHYNRQFLKLWSVPAELLGERDDQILIHFVAPKLADPSQFKERIQAINRTSARTEEALLLNDGRTIERRSYPVVFPGQERGRVWLFRDVTERKRVEQSLRIFQYCIDNAPESIHWLGADGRVMYANRAVCRALGYTKKEIESLSLWDIDPVYGKERFLGEWAKYQEKRKGGTMFVETVHRRKDGTLISVEVVSNHIWIGDAELHVAFARDITERKRAEEALRESEERFSAVVNQAKDGIVLIQEKRLVFCNQALADMLGYRREELEGTPFIDRVAPESRELVGGRVQSRLQGESPPTVYEARLARRDGRIMEAELSGGMIHHRGKPTDVGIIRDITGRKQAEQAVRDSEAKLRSIFRAAPIAIVILGPDRKLHSVNDRTVEMLGYAPEELVGEAPRKVYASPEEYERVGQALYSGLWQQGMAQTEGRMRRKDGTELNVLLSAAPLQPDCPALGAVVTVLDVTERKRAEAEVRESQQMLQTVLDTIPARVFWKNRDLTFLGCNRSFASDAGLPSSAEVVGKSDFELVWAEQAESYRTDDRWVMETSQPRLGYEEPQTRRDGRQIWLRTSKVPLLDLHGRIRGVLGTYEDITERKHAEMALRASLEEKEALLKEVHHRVKNNLQIVTSLLSLQSARETQESVKAALRDMQSRIWAMALLHDALYRSASLAKIDFGLYVRNLCTQLARSYQHGGQPVRFEVQIPNLCLDLERAVPCGLIISELVTNAFKHAFPDGRGGEIQVSSRSAAPAEIEIRVADNGVGLPAGFDLARARSLGLQLVARLTDQLGGVLRVEPGPGADFRIRFALELKAALPSAEDSLSQPSTPNQP